MFFTEKTKHLKKNPAKPKTKAEKKEVKKQEFVRKEIIERVEKEVLKKVVEVRKEKKEEAQKIAKAKADYIFKVADKVRILDSNAVGTIERIEKKKALINYGLFTTETNLNKLELVEPAK